MRATRSCLPHWADECALSPHSLSLNFAAAYLIGPMSALSLVIAALRVPRKRQGLRLAILTACAGLLASVVAVPLPKRPPLQAMRALLINSGLAKLLKQYHSFKLIEEVPIDEVWATESAGRGCWACEGGMVTGRW